jgi:NADH:ubiquinone oxidoreductase subunit F (NADH-binding)
MRHDPHKLVEGCLVAGRAMNATAGNFDSSFIFSKYLILNFFSLYLHSW